MIYFSTFEPTYFENIAFAIVLRVKKIAKISKTALKAMVNAHVIHVGIFLVGCQVFGDTS